MNCELKKSDLTTLMFLSWRDIKAPKMGGAEIYTHEMLKRMDKSNYRIIHFSPLFEGSDEIEDIDGIKYYRSGSLLSVIHDARKFYNKNKNKIDYVVNQCNTHRFFTKLWVKKDKRIFFIHQLTKKIWFYHASFPFNIIGYLLESPMLKLNRRDLTLTVSESTKDDLIKLGFRSEKVSILPEGLSFTPWNKNDFKIKEKDPTIIYVGRFAEYKGIDASITTFSKIKNQFPSAKMWVVGKPNMEYIEKKLNPICLRNGLTVSFDENPADIMYKGFVSEEEKLSLMSRAHILMFPSIREGWGLTISEAAAVGTPSLVYNAPGTRDAVQQGKSGYMVDLGDLESLKDELVRVFKDEYYYEQIRESAYQFSTTLHWDNTAIKFKEFCDNKLLHKK